GLGRQPRRHRLDRLVRIGLSYWARGARPRGPALLFGPRRDVASADEERPCRYPSRSTTAWCTSRTGSARTRSTAMCSAPSSFGSGLVRRGQGGPFGFGPARLNLLGPGFHPAEGPRFLFDPGTTALCFHGRGPMPTPSPTLSVAVSRSTPGRSSASAPRAPAPASISATPTARCWNSFPIIATTETAPDDRPRSEVPPDDTMAPQSDDGARHRARL